MRLALRRPLRVGGRVVSPGHPQSSFEDENGPRRTLHLLLGPLCHRLQHLRVRVHPWQSIASSATCCSAGGLSWPPSSCPDRCLHACSLRTVLQSVSRLLMSTNVHPPSLSYHDRSQVRRVAVAVVDASPGLWWQKQAPGSRSRALSPPLGSVLFTDFPPSQYSTVPLQRG